MRSPRVTIRDVARRAGVSVGTVSNVITRREGVSEAKRAAIERAIGELGYVPNGMAQDLRRGRGRFVGVCAPHTGIGYYGALVDAFDAAAAGRGYELLQVLSRHDPEAELRRVTALLTQRVAGIVLVPTAAPEATLDLLARTGVPTVVVDRADAAARFDHVTFDNQGAMRAVVAHLAAAGHRRLALVVRYPRLAITRARIAAFRGAARRLGLAATVAHSGDDEARFSAALAGRLADPAAPTALVASNSGLALWAWRALKGLGRRCPDDLSLVSFDEPDWADLVEPGLTAIRHPSGAIASSAWDLMFRRIEASGAPPASVVHEARLVVRGSVAPVRREGTVPEGRGGTAGAFLPVRSD